MSRIRNESGFTLIEIAIVVVIIAVLVALAIPAYMGFTGGAQNTATEANVRSAIPAAEKMAGTNGNYAGINGNALRAIAAGMPSTIKAVAVNSSNGYCIQDTENSGASYYNYVGGNASAVLKPGYSLATVQGGTCLQAVGVAAS